MMAKNMEHFFDVEDEPAPLKHLMFTLIIKMGIWVVPLVQGLIL